MDEIATGSTVLSKSMSTPRVFPLNPIVNKSCHAKSSVVIKFIKLSKIVLSLGLELLYHAGQHPVFYR